MTSRVLLLLLLAGAALNLAAGARRPLIERAILSRGHYPAADRAALAVRRLVPPTAVLDVVTYAGDVFPDGLDCAIWFDYRLKWLLYPRAFTLYRSGGAGPPERVPYYPRAPRPVGPGAAGPRYVLYFRGTREPGPPPPPQRVVVREPMFLLTREEGPSRGAGAGAAEAAGADRRG